MAAFEFRTSDFDWCQLRAVSYADAYSQCEGIALDCDDVELRTLEYDDESGLWVETACEPVKARVQIAAE